MRMWGEHATESNAYCGDDDNAPPTDVAVPSVTDDLPIA